jgi:hypothetical protein
MKIRALLVMVPLLLVSAAASAQVTLTDSASGMSLTLSGGWTVVENAEAAVAVNEEGCLLVLKAVPEAEAAAALEGLDSFLSSFITNVAVAEAGMDEAENAFAAHGTGSVDGETIEWVVAGGIAEGFFGIVFAAATPTAAICSQEMGALLESL